MNQPSAIPTRYDVHLFAVVRVKIPNITAASHRAAIVVAIENSADIYERFSSVDSEFAEEFSHFLVDVVGDEQGKQSQWFYSAQEPLVRYLLRLVRWRDGKSSVGDSLDKIVADVRQALAATI